MIHKLKGDDLTKYFDEVIARCEAYLKGSQKQPQEQKKSGN